MTKIGNVKFSQTLIIKIERLHKDTVVTVSLKQVLWTITTLFISF